MPPTFLPRSSKRGRYHFAELVMAPGPQILADTQGATYADLFGADWALELRADDHKLHAYQRQASGEWAEVTAAELPDVIGPVLPDGARHIALAFDQAARVIVAYEVDGQVNVTRWDAGASAYVQDPTVAGRDPVLLIDATVKQGRVPGSDVALWYLTPDRTGVRYRYQGEAYGTEHTLHDHSAALVLDAAQPLAYRYQLLVSDGHGVPLPQALVSDLYDVRVTQAGTVQATGIKSGAYMKVILPESVTDGVLAASTGGILGGSYDESLVERSVTDGVLAASTGGILGGSYDEALVERSVTDGVIAASAGGILGGNYHEVVIEHGQAEGVVSASTTGILGGSYDAA